MKVLVTFLIFCLTQNAVASWQTKVESVFKAEIKKIETNENDFSLWVARKGQVGQLNSSMQRVPASLSKIATALAFLESDGLTTNFETEVYYTGEVKDGILHGDLYLKGGGDPSFVTEVMDELIGKVQRFGIRRVTGSLFYDESYFDTDYYSDGRQNRRVDRAYDAPVGGLSYNWNSMTIYIRPALTKSRPPKVFLQPNLKEIRIVNKAKTVAGDRQSLKVSRRFDGQYPVIEISGSIGVGAKEKPFYKSIKDPGWWTTRCFQHRLQIQDIQVTGEVQAKVVPKEAKLVAVQKGWSGARILRAMSKFSNNFVAEMLTKKMGVQVNTAGTMKNGLSKVRDFLVAKGWASKDFVFDNPSGLTRANRMRMDQLGELLLLARKRFGISPEFLSSLPLSGVDGTLKSRMRHALHSKVRAKTGYMSGIVGLAGYLESRDGDPITFAFIYNGPAKKDWDVRAMYGKILWNIYQIDSTQ